GRSRSGEPPLPDLTEGRDRSGETGAPDSAAGVGETARADGAGLEQAAGLLLPAVQGLIQSLGGLAGYAGKGFSVLSQKLQWDWVDHSTLVKKLLHEFREGDPTRALQHAFSIVPPDPGHRIVGWGHRLPWSRAIYDLIDLLRRPARGEPVA